jgi:hypothetical protein
MVHLVAMPIWVWTNSSQDPLLLPELHSARASRSIGAAAMRMVRAGLLERTGSRLLLGKLCEAVAWRTAPLSAERLEARRDEMHDLRQSVNAKASRHPDLRCDMSSAPVARTASARYLTRIAVDAPAQMSGEKNRFVISRPY